ncbi:transposase [Pseudomonas putida]|uniref:REP-associated tyrosine transposase n=1 Tax=Pseudomonas putida TaxID=303 RepID=UPI002363500F|nr:transposase [Pseudomonas putida]MDD1968093.1 transposase [Pseudomonas putida]
MPDFPKGKTLRNGRYSEPGRIYLITSVTQGRTPVFADWRLGRLVVEELRAAQESGMADSMAWVVMPDHLHWLMALKDSQLTPLMQRVKSRSARSVNSVRGGHTQLWQRGFYDRALRSEDDLLRMARYVVANPLRAGLVRRIGDYPLWDAIWL